MKVTSESAYSLVSQAINYLKRFFWAVLPAKNYRTRLSKPAFILGQFLGNFLMKAFL